LGTLLRVESDWSVIYGLLEIKIVNWQTGGLPLARPTGYLKFEALKRWANSPHLPPVRNWRRIVWNNLPQALPLRRRLFCHSVYNAIQTVRSPKTIPLIASIVHGDVSEIETSNGAGRLVVDPIIFVVFTMLIKR
jgi:hypothetical protein